MNNTRYSPGTGSFYPFDLDYGNKLPADVIEVSLDDFNAAMARQPGHTFAFVKGQLVITPPAPTPFANLSAPFMAEVRSTREQILNRLAGIGFRYLVSGNTGTAAVIAEASEQLLAITEAPEVLAAIAAENMVDLKDAVKARYKAIAAAVPLEVRNAFNQVSM